ncbi:hypothetical protein [Klebsiella sp. 141130]|uniref:hypothetical protein n=1 Tax=Klebsiella TaxID=570 RepID=UPI003D33E7E7
MIKLAQINADALDRVIQGVNTSNHRAERLRDEMNEFKEFITEKLEGRDDVRRIDKEILAHIKLIGRAQYNIFEDTKNTWNTLHTHLSNLDFYLEGYEYEWAKQDPENYYKIFRKQSRDSAKYFLNGDKGFYENEDRK